MFIDPFHTEDTYDFEMLQKHIAERPSVILILCTVLLVQLHTVNKDWTRECNKSSGGCNTIFKECSLNPSHWSQHAAARVYLYLRCLVKSGTCSIFEATSNI